MHFCKPQNNQIPLSVLLSLAKKNFPRCCWKHKPGHQIKVCLTSTGDKQIKNDAMTHCERRQSSQYLCTTTSFRVTLTLLLYFIKCTESRARWYNLGSSGSRLDHHGRLWAKQTAAAMFCKQGKQDHTGLSRGDAADIWHPQPERNNIDKSNGGQRDSCANGLELAPPHPFQ